MCIHQPEGTPIENSQPLPPICCLEMLKIRSELEENAIPGCREVGLIDIRGMRRKVWQCSWDQGLDCLT